MKPLVLQGRRIPQIRERGTELTAANRRSDTARPYGIESIARNTRFEVFAEQVSWSSSQLSKLVRSIGWRSAATLQLSES